MTPAPAPAPQPAPLDLALLLARLQRMASQADGLLPPATRSNNNNRNR